MNFVVVMVTFCYGLNVVSPKIHMLKTTPNLIVFGDRAFMEIIKINEVTG